MISRTPCPGWRITPPPRCGACLPPWPPLPAAPLARHAPRARVCRAHHGRSPNVIATRLQAIKSATPRTTAAGVRAPPALLGQALVAPLRVLLPVRADVAPAMAPRAQSPPAFPLGATLPGAGAVFAPRLRVACGAQRERSAAADALHKDAGLAPVPARRGKTTWGHGHWPCPTCLRPTCVAWAAASLRHACWARTSSQPPRDKGTAPQAAVRARAFQWSRSLLRCWQERTPYEASVSLHALKHRGSPLLHPVVHGSRKHRSMPLTDPLRACVSCCAWTGL
jgi:hypothetical protein